MSDFEDRIEKVDEDSGESQATFSEKIIKLSRVAKVVKGGRRFSFSALVSIGDSNGKVGIGFGKANEVADAISKANQNAKKNIVSIYLNKKKTVAHEIIGRYKTSRVVIRPASPGTGVIAGGAVRSIMECAGVHDVLTKVLGSKNQLNVAKAALDGLRKIRNIKEVAKTRSKSMLELF